MSISPTKFTPKEMKTTLISVYSYKDKLFQGTLSNPHFQKPLVFENTMQFLILIESICDTLCFPQKAMELRHFPFEKPVDTAEVISLPFTAKTDFSDKLPLAKLELEIVFRQNASWQGCLTWTEKNLSCSFRSALELLILIDSILRIF